MNEDILQALEDVKTSVDDVESKVGWVEIHTSGAINVLNEILEVLKKIEKKL